MVIHFSKQERSKSNIRVVRECASRAAKLSAWHGRDGVEMKAPAVSRVQTPSNRKVVLDHTC